MRLLGALLFFVSFVTGAWAAGEAGGAGALGSTVLHCYSYSHLEDGDRKGPELLIKRHSQYDDWRLYTYSVRVGETKISGTGLLARAKHYTRKIDDIKIPYSDFVLIDKSQAIKLNVTTYAWLPSIASGYADVYKKSARARQLVHSYEGCVASGLWEPHKMDDDAI